MNYYARFLIEYPEHILHELPLFLSVPRKEHIVLYPFFPLSLLIRKLHPRHEQLVQLAVLFKPRYLQSHLEIVVIEQIWVDELMGLRVKGDMVFIVDTLFHLQYTALESAIFFKEQSHKGLCGHIYLSIFKEQLLWLIKTLGDRLYLLQGVQTEYMLLKYGIINMHFEHIPVLIKGQYLLICDQEDIVSMREGGCLDFFR